MLLATQKTMFAEHDPQSELECAVCGSDQLVVEDDSTVSCLDCRESFSLVQHENFALMETDGWIAGIRVDGERDLAQ